MSAAQTRATVVIIEDNLDNRMIYRTILEHYGYEVLEAGDGQSGVQLVRDTLPDVVLMDISIPIIDGHQATRMLKADPVTASIPVMALTAHAMAEDRQRAAEAGCDAYLAKPAEPKQVLAEVQRLIAEREARTAAI
ncbi:response regulator [Longimicrobium terrae]|uniref:CheY-like chemotaxis protein n=1 Tax=Longimicrobium terrae TaxID=1639882 RepID=A0A841GYR1_9BACT|nr:response regulator [Longimicrobium terrae]MBB4636584.1 CheY-like chemotaxis protein [Longimicrobium terrae]MBB6070892.1 CheY-like chemotaxis protein [Longimicrobium terrae]NNC28916.1 response regulator [Longimicrobium terrae]